MTTTTDADDRPVDARKRVRSRRSGKAEATVDEVHGLGWRPDLPDQRDFVFRAATDPRTLPSTARVDPKTEPPVRNQENIGSCTAFAGTYLHEQVRRTAGMAPMDPAPLFTYWVTRLMEGGDQLTRVDSGATMRVTMKAMVQYGVPSDELWPYVMGHFRNKPTKAVFKKAEQRQVLSYQRVDGLDAMRASIADGYPVMIGIMVYGSLMTSAVARNGVVPMPGRTERLLGGHAIAINEYDDVARRVRFRNSWGPWGVKGHGFLPYEYVSNPSLSMDWWTIRSVEPG